MNLLPVDLSRKIRVFSCQHSMGGRTICVRVITNFTKINNKKMEIFRDVGMDSIKNLFCWWTQLRIALSLPESMSFALKHSCQGIKIKMKGIYGKI